MALGNDRINVGIATKIARLLQDKNAGQYENSELRKKIFAHVREKEQFSYYKNREKSPITIFGDLAEIYTCDIVIHEKMDKVAQMVNYVYCRSDVPKFETLDDKKQEIDEKWEKAVIFDKDSSRAVFQNIENISRITDNDWTVLTDDKKLEILAENEHLRWNAYHLVNGIRKLNLDEINAENGKLRDENNNLLKHGCLVSFGKLVNVAVKVNEIREQNGNSDEENYQATDRRITKHFPVFIEELKKTK